MFFCFVFSFAQLTLVWQSFRNGRCFWEDYSSKSTRTEIFVTVHFFSLFENESTIDTSFSMLVDVTGESNFRLKHLLANTTNLSYIFSFHKKQLRKFLEFRLRVTKSEKVIKWAVYIFPRHGHTSPCT